MHQYWSAYKINLLTELAYPVEILAFIVRKVINLFFLVFFWKVLSSTNPDIFEFKKLISYFLISEAVQDLTFTTGSKYGRDIQRLIKFGTLSNYMIKPINTLRFLYAGYIGAKTSVACYAVVTLALGIYLSPPAHLIAIPLFIVSMVLTAATGAGVNVFLAAIGFYSPEANGIKNAYEHINKIMSGALIPLVYFPPALQKIAVLLPFPVLSYFPTSILQDGGLDATTLQKLALSLFWAVVLLVSSNAFWNYSVKNYDGVGI